jgi:hypothetical protein
MHRLYPDVITSGQAGRSAKFRLGGDAECRAAVRHKCGRLPWQTVRVILQPTGQGYGPRTWYLPRHRLAEAETLALRKFGDLVRWEVRPFSDGPRPVEAGAEDRFAALQNIKTGVRNALLDSVPAHPAPTAPTATLSDARAPPD